MVAHRFSGPAVMSAALAALTVVYLISSPEARFEADDAYDYAAVIEFGDVGEMLFPNHLIYLPIVNAIYEPVRAVAPALRPLPLMAALGAATGAASVILFYVLMRSWLGVSKWRAVAGAAGLGASYGFWRYTAEAEVYALATLAALLLLLGVNKLNPGRISAVPLIAGLATVAVLAHSLNVALVAVLPLLLIQQGWRMRKVLIAGLLFSLMLIASTFGAYRIARSYEAAPAMQSTYVGFFSRTATSARPSISEVARGVAAMGSTVVASNALFTYESIRETLKSRFPRNAIDDEVSMGATTPGWIRLIAPVTMVAALGGIVYLIWRTHSARFLSWRTGLVLVLWVLVYLGVLLFAGGLAQPEVWLLLLVPIWALVTGALERAKVSEAVPLTVAALLLLNSLVSGFFPLYLGENRQAQLAEWFVENASPGDLLLTADSAGLARYAAYASAGHAAHIGIHLEDILVLGDLIENDASTQEILNALSERDGLSGYKPTAGGGRLFLTRDVFEPPSWLEASNSEAADALRTLGNLAADRFQGVEGTDFYLVRGSDLSAGRRTATSMG